MSTLGTSPARSLRVIQCALLIAVTLLVCDQALSQESTSKESERIKGVATFLLDRANENYFYIFQNKLTRNEAFQCLFPNTFVHAKDGHLRSLLRSDKQVWREEVEQDIERLVNKITFKVVINALKEADIREAADAIETIASSYVKETAAARDSLARVDAETKAKLDKSRAEVEEAFRNVASFKKDFPELVKTFVSSGETMQAVSCEADVDRPTKVDWTDFRDTFDQFETSLDRARAAIKKDAALLKGEARSQLRVASKAFEQTLRKLILAHFGDDAEILEIREALTNSRIDGQRKYLGVVLGVLKYFKELRDENNEVGKRAQNMELASFVRKPNDTDYRRFERYVVFFAEIADATTAESVQSLLEEVTLPPVSFGLKRTVGESPLFITAYLGGSGNYAANRDDEDDEQSDVYDTVGLFAPIGIEYVTRVRRASSVSFMLSVFDFAHPINLEIEGEESSLRLGDVVVPGFYVSYGFADWPLAAGIGVSRGSSFTRADDEETRVHLFLGFDLPLFSIF